MALYYGKSYREFNKELDKKHKLYEQLGMSQEQIDAIDEFDRNEFNSDCVYNFHTQPLDNKAESDFDDDKNPLYKTFLDSITVEFKATFSEPYDWMEDISSTSLLEKIRSLTPADLELLDAYVFGEMTQTELAAKKGISQKNICKKLNRIRRFLAEK